MVSKKLITMSILLAMASLAMAQSKAPDFSVKDTKGKTWTLKSLEKDKIYFFEFWATWCTTCKEIAPIIEKFVEENRGKTFEHLSISLDTDKKALAKYLSSKKPEYPVLLDPKFTMAKDWDAMEVPMMYLVKNGKILWSKKGKVKKSELDSALKKASAE